MRHVEWEQRGYRLLLIEVRPGYFHFFISADGKSYAIYDRFKEVSLDEAWKNLTTSFDPTAYEMVPPPFPISRELALRGEVGIPEEMEPLVRLVEES